MVGTPFKNPPSIETFAKHKIYITEKRLEADVIVAHNYKKLLPFLVRNFKKRYLVWTNEPRYDISFTNEIKMPFRIPNINVMNVYGNEVFWHSLHFLGSYHFDESNNLGVDLNIKLENISKEKLRKSNRRHKVAALLTNNTIRKSTLIKDGMNIDLSQLRCAYSYSGHERNLLDIYGKGWPSGYALANSGYGYDYPRPWWEEKIRILKDYKFNLCLENTGHEFYITEKIWHAIYSGTLPIYHSLNSKIYDLFPKDSFLDVAHFPTADSLFTYIQNLRESEYLHRLNCCIDVFNECRKIKLEYNRLNTHEVEQKIICRLTRAISANTN